MEGLYNRTTQKGIKNIGIRSLDGLPYAALESTHTSQTVQRLLAHDGMLRQVQIECIKRGWRPAARGCNSGSYLAELPISTVGHSGKSYLLFLFVCSTIDMLDCFSRCGHPPRSDRAGICESDVAVTCARASAVE